jgi:hypothetical protein
VQRDGDRHAERSLPQRGKEGDKTLGEIVEGDGRSGEQAHAQELPVMAAVIVQSGVRPDSSL